MSRKTDARAFFAKWRADYDFKTLIGSTGAMLVTAAFAVYNGYLGIAHASPWHGGICAYYLLLHLLRLIVIRAERAPKDRAGADSRKERAVLAASGLLLALNLCLIGPFYLMVSQRRPVTLTLIPAIAMAAYTTCKVIMASVSLRKRRASSDSFVWLLRTISFIDALVSIPLQKSSMTRTGSQRQPVGPVPADAQLHRRAAVHRDAAEHADHGEQR